MSYREGKEVKSDSMFTAMINFQLNFYSSTKNNVVYQFSCFRDENITYIGETRRQLFRRVEDHISKNNNSAIYDHLYQCMECQTANNIVNQFRVINRCNRYNIYSFESLLIAKHRPVLNTQLGPGRGTMVSLSLY